VLRLNLFETQYEVSARMATLRDIPDSRPAHALMVVSG